jgi:hypothetical protein
MDRFSHVNGTGKSGPGNAARPWAAPHAGHERLAGGAGEDAIPGGCESENIIQAGLMIVDDVH